MAKKKKAAPKKAAAVKKATPKKKTAPKKAAPKKAAQIKPQTNQKAVAFTKLQLPQLAEAVETGISIGVQFKNGGGSLTVILKRKKQDVEQGSLEQSGTILLSQAQSGDVLTFNGSASGTATITFNRSTEPASPLVFTDEPINDIADIL